MTVARHITLTSFSGSITAGGTAQTALAANAKRKFLWLQNPPSSSENVSFDLDGTAVGDGTDITLEPGAAIGFDTVVPTGAVSVIAATTGTKFIVKEG